jgi:hypothetical protein
MGLVKATGTSDVPHEILPTGVAEDDHDVSMLLSKFLDTLDHSEDRRVMRKHEKEPLTILRIGGGLHDGRPAYRSLFQLLALLAERLAAVTLLPVRGFDVVARLAARVVVVNGRLDGMPGTYFRH